MSNLQNWLWLDLGKIDTWILQLNSDIRNILKGKDGISNDELFDVRYLQGQRDTLIEIKKWILEDLRNNEK